MPEQSTKKVCSFEGCERLANSKGLCKTHNRQRWAGRPLTPIRKKYGPVCRFEGCGAEAVGHGYCTGHFKQFKANRKLTPLIERRAKGSPPRIICDEVPCLNRELGTPCHVFRGSKRKERGDLNGYGTFTINCKTYTVHTYVWEKENGSIPKGLMVDHICRVRPCCNIDHLRLVTHEVNNLENSTSVAAINASKTHCLRGHEFTPSNTYVVKVTGGRQCRTCNSARRQAKQKGTTA